MDASSQFTTDSFGQGFYLARKEEWVDYYIDYAAMMEFLTMMNAEHREEDDARRAKRRRGHGGHSSTSFLADLVPTSIGETEPLVVDHGGGLIRRMSESGLNLMKNALHSSSESAESHDELKTSSWTSLPKERPDSRPRGGSWPIDSELSTGSSSSSFGPIKPDSDQAEFCSMLDDQIEKVGLFYLKEQGILADKLSKLACEREVIHTESDDGGEHIPVTVEMTEDLVEGYRAIGMDLLELFHFVAMNMTVLRKLLNRHDAIVRRFGEKKPPLLRQWYVMTRTEDKEAFLRTMLNHDGLMAIAGAVRRGMADVSIMQSPQAIQGDVELSVNSNEMLWRGGHLPELHLEYFIGEIDAVAAKMKKAEKRSFEDFVVAGSVGNSISFEPSILKNRFQPIRDQGDADMRFYVDWRERERKETADRPIDVDYIWPFGLQLNLFSTFLYMTNYFVAGPTSVRYIDALGGHDALASMVIGATPWAVMISTFLFSIWTNYSFKQPLVCSGILLCLGNFMYASALRYDSIALVMAGRMAIGLGGPRLINRRYIADTATLQQRTAVSAAFVTFSAAGTAAGPGLAVVLQHFDTAFKVPLLGSIVVNGLTAPGYFMLVVWLFFFVVMLFSFEEPKRIGLQQQKSLPMNFKTQSSIQDDSEAKEVEVPVPTNTDLHQHYGSVANPKTGSKSSVENMDADRALDEDNAASNSSPCCCLPDMTWPVLMCMMMLFVNKLSIESLISSSPILTENRYDWSVHMIGALGVAIGLLVIPLSICIGWLSRRYEDGKLLLWLLYFTTAGLILLLDVDELGGTGRGLAGYGLFGVGPHRYIYGCLMSFSGLQAMESLIMSTLSKVVPYSLAVGTCNSGLLNTEIGTFGRAFGDLMVTFIGFTSLENLLDLLISPLLILMVGCIALVKLNYGVFEV